MGKPKLLEGSCAGAAVNSPSPAEPRAAPPSARHVSKDSANSIPIPRHQTCPRPFDIQSSSIQSQISWGRVQVPLWALSEFLSHRSAGMIEWLFRATKFWGSLFCSDVTGIESLHLPPLIGFWFASSWAEHTVPGTGREKAHR